MQGKKLEAKACLVSEISMAPDDTDVLVSMGSMFLSIGDTDYATNCLLKSLESDYANADAYYYLGLASSMKGRMEDAAEFFTHALDIKPDYVEALRDSALLYLVTGKLDYAAKRIEEALPLAEKDKQIQSLSRKIKIAQVIRRAADFLCRFIPLFSHRKSRT